MIAVDQNAGPLHLRQHGDKRTLHRLVNSRHAFPDKAGFQDLPEAERHVRILRRIGRGLVDLHLVEGDLGFARSEQRLDADRLMPEMTGAECVHAVRSKPRRLRVGQEQRVVEGRDRDPITLQDLEVIFHVLRDLQDRRVLQHRLQDRQRFVQIHLPFGGRRRA